MTIDLYQNLHYKMGILKSNWIHIEIRCHLPLKAKKKL